LLGPGQLNLSNISWAAPRGERSPLLHPHRYGLCRGHAVASEATDASERVEEMRHLRRHFAENVYGATGTPKRATIHHVPKGNSVCLCPFRHASYASRYAARKARSFLTAASHRERVSAENVGFRPNRCLAFAGRCEKRVLRTPATPRKRPPSSRVLCLTCSSRVVTRCSSALKYCS